MGEFDIFDAFQLDYQNLTHQIIKKQYTMHRGLWWKSVTIHRNIFHQIFEESVSIKISLRQSFALYGINWIFGGKEFLSPTHKNSSENSPSLDKKCWKE